MTCNYKPDPKRPGRCGDPTVDGAKMCPTHQERHRNYMRAYRARKKAEEKRNARRTTMTAIGKLLDELIDVEVKEQAKPDLLAVPQGRDDWDDDTLADIRAFLNRADELQAWLNQWGIPR